LQDIAKDDEMDLVSNYQYNDLVVNPYDALDDVDFM